MKLFVFDIYIKYIFILYFWDKYIFEKERIKILIKPVTNYCLFLSNWRVAFFAGGDFSRGGGLSFIAALASFRFCGARSVWCIYVQCNAGAGIFWNYQFTLELAAFAFESDDVVACVELILLGTEKLACQGHQSLGQSWCCTYILPFPFLPRLHWTTSKSLSDDFALDLSFATWGLSFF